MNKPSDVGGVRDILGPELSQHLLALQLGLETAAGHTQLPAQPGHRGAISKLINPGKLQGDTCSFAKSTAGSKKILVHP